MKIHKTETARAFITITPDWTGDIPEGSFVRFEPGPNDSDLTIKQKKAMFEAMGATVKVLPRKNKEKAVATFTRVNTVSPKETVRALVKASNYQNKEAILELCEEIME